MLLEIFRLTIVTDPYVHRRIGVRESYLETLEILSKSNCRVKDISLVFSGQRGTMKKVPEIDIDLKDSG